jgi:hypothetical protein
VLPRQYRGRPGEAAAVLWRKVFPSDVRDMVRSRTADAGRTFEAVARSCTPTAGRSPPVGIEVAR